MPDAIHTYFAAIEALRRTGAATEHSYRPALQKLIESLAPGVRALNEPQRVACGSPDFIISLTDASIGHIETKDVGKDLDAAAASDQLQRYREALPNLILTDYLDFRWYVNGELRLQAAGEAQVRQLLRSFLNAPGFTIANPEDLARRLAGAAQLARQAIAAALADEAATGSLRLQLEAFQQVLLHDLTVVQFADMYAQTICYGLFSARCMHHGPQPFSRQTAPYDLPATNPFLRWLFTHIAGPELDSRVAWTVDAAAAMLAHTDIEAVLAGFGRGGGREDPVFHFYETFLAAYDPSLRQRRGVFYTPQPIVRYLVACVDELLRSRFHLAAGLADTAMLPARGKHPASHRVLILDPAAGTGAFLHEVVERIRGSFAGNTGLWSGYVARHLLPRLFGFELLMAPYAVAHLKLGLLLESSGYQFHPGERLRIYLTNTLEEAHAAAGLPIFTRHLAEEANAASTTKLEQPVMVVLGNPPYSGHSANDGAWIRGLLHGEDSLTRKPTHSYFQVDGEPLGERNPKWLNDDYVKFLRFAQWRIEQTGYGILAFITNNGYLENPTFRGMRQALLDTFSEIFILNLHGDRKKRERAPDGGKDENIFDIQQGVAIGIFVKTSSRSRQPQVHYCDLWGMREQHEDGQLTGGKFQWLGTHDLTSTPWQSVKPRTPLYLFAPHASPRRQDEYERGWLLTDAMPVNVLGFQSHRDSFATAFTREPLGARAALMANPGVSDADVRARFDLRDTRDWQLARARQQVRDLADPEAPIIECWYRPLDRRWVYYSTAAMDFPRNVILENVAGRPNLCLNTVRQTRMPAWRHALVSDAPAPAVYVELKDGSNLFPLYLYDGSGNGHLFHDVRREIAGVNFSETFLAAVSKATGLRYLGAGAAKLRGYTAEQLFSYMYALLHAPSFAERYSEFLRRGWPRIPLTSQPALFRRLSQLGSKLIACHLLRGVAPGCAFPVAGGNEVERAEYEVGSPGRIWINQRQYFDGISSEVWEATLGGYTPAAQWLKDRRESTLDYEALGQYRALIGAMAAGLGITVAIEAAIPAWPLP